MGQFNRKLAVEEAQACIEKLMTDLYAARCEDDFSHIQNELNKTVAWRDFLSTCIEELE